MNFLSHFYFDRHSTDAHVVMGSVLPDLVKNAVSHANLHPQKIGADLIEHNEASLLKGWKKHLEVDVYFHSSDFFMDKTQALKLLLKPILEGSPVRPSFLAHIGIELLLDHLLIENNLIKVDAFYQQLNRVDKKSLNTFLIKSKLDQTEQFFKFLDQFLSSRYLFSYQKIENISYALNRICLRVWPEGLSKEQTEKLTEQLSFFKKVLQKDFISIFRFIEEKLN